MTIIGKCLCGDVSYTCIDAPILEGNCHCVDCKKSSGSGYSPTIFFSKDSILISGKVKYFESKGQSGNPVVRGFCSNCGSQMFGKPESMPDFVAIRAGALDDISVYKSTINIFTKHNAAWDSMDSSLPKLLEIPT